jgi:hypothetical protein
MKVRSASSMASLWTLPGWESRFLVRGDPSRLRSYPIDALESRVLHHGLT